MSTGSSDPPSTVVVYWRPGCGFCANLLSRLRKTGLPLTEINIWDDPEAAAVVRSHANGSETVPTVLIGDIAMVNPSSGQIVEAVKVHAPALLGGA